MFLVLLIHAAATWFMVGLIWFVQIVHYPLFSSVGSDGFSAYEELHQRLTTWVVGPAMLIELATGLWLLRWSESLDSRIVWLGLMLIAVIWLCTAIASVPAHNALQQKFSQDAHRSLVSTNWIRTAAWSVRGILVLLMIRSLISVKS
ncbi:MAG: hypothetical protein Fues2KO_07620 [Fuerstiella sp.]